MAVVSPLKSVHILVNWLHNDNCLFARFIEEALIFPFRGVVQPAEHGLLAACYSVDSRPDRLIIFEDI